MATLVWNKHQKMHFGALSLKFEPDYSHLKLCASESGLICTSTA